MAHYPFRFWPQGKAVPIDRTLWQIPASAVMLITTGSRLDTEMPVWWADRMLAFLEAHQDVHWLLVGVPDGWQHSSLSAHSRIHGITKQLALLFLWTKTETGSGPYAELADPARLLHYPSGQH